MSGAAFPVSVFRPTPPCAHCGAAMRWRARQGTWTGADGKSYQAIREVDASRHATECPQLLIDDAERAVAIRGGTTR